VVWLLPTTSRVRGKNVESVRRELRGPGVLDFAWLLNWLRIWGLRRRSGMWQLRGRGVTGMRTVWRRRLRFG